MVEETLPQLPEDIAGIAKKLAPRMIEDAVINKSGARFIENLISSSYLENVDSVVEIFERFEREEAENKKEEVIETKQENTIDEVMDLWNFDELEKKLERMLDDV
jgi:hypothetical protein